MKLKQIDGLFSKYIRKRNSIDGYNMCFTCGRVERIENLDCGHFISRKVMATRFNEINCQPQCKRCNQFLNGNLKVFEENLIEVYGQEKIDELKSLKNKIVKNIDIGQLYDSYFSL